MTAKFAHLHGPIGRAGGGAVIGVGAAALALAAFIGGASIPAQPASADEIVNSEAGRIARGGKLYDKWYAVVGVDAPEDTHPSYPSAGKAKGKATWRCKECHGWDYKGKDGAYGKGKHFTGIKGIGGMAGAEPDAIVAVLQDKNHGYTDDMLEDEDFQDLAIFVSKGQVDMDQYIDRATKSVKGDKDKGVAYFNTICVGCHDIDGLEPKAMPPMGELIGNPWEVMHKIMNGQPGERMPALRALDRQVILDIMAHLPTLPKEK